MIDISNVKYIGDKSFSHCDAITHVDIPNRITTIIEFTFANCSNLESVYIP